VAGVLALLAVTATETAQVTLAVMAEMDYRVQSLVQQLTTQVAVAELLEATEAEILLEV
jgi:hypothetical protein